MSKVDAQRALREARYAASAQPGARTAAPAKASAKPKTSGEPRLSGEPKPAAKPKAAEPTSDLCGHRSMNGRTCTRTGGHSEKNHRYG